MQLAKILFLTWTFSLLCSCASSGKGSITEKQQAILKMRDDVLTQLYKEKPSTRAQINAASGYAVFSNANINLLFVAAGTGYGVVKNSVSGQHTYMNMAEAGIGLGIGAKDYRIVMVFHNQEAIRHFVEKGWTLGGNADAAVKASDKGASLEGEAYLGGVSVYSITKTGIALQATLKGTKFWADSNLN